MLKNLFLEYQEIFHSTQSNEKTKELWKQCLNPLKSFLPMALTRKYAQKYLTQSDKLEVIEIVKSVKQSFISLVDEKEWLGDNKIDIIAKSEELLENVGYPDWIFDDNQLSDYYQNLVIIFYYSKRVQF
jgi:predicted metalloendopeptidase